MPFEKKFLKKWFSAQITSKPPSPQEMGEKEKSIEKEKKKEKKKEKGKREKKKSSKSLFKQRGSQYFKRQKTLQLQKSFLMWFHFLPLHHIISTTIPKSLRKFS
jgi:hypothetical protein